MKLVAYNPWTLLDEMNAGMDRLFSHGRSRTGGGKTAVTPAPWHPSVDIKELDDRFVLYADMPGIDPEDIEVTMEKTILTISGQRSADKAAEGDRYAHLERVQGVFYRRFALPASADGEKVRASGKHGVLEVVIPKREKAQPRRIPIAA